MVDVAGHAELFFADAQDRVEEGVADDAGEEREREHAPDHQEAADHFAEARDGGEVSVADGGERDEGPPQPVGGCLDLCAGCSSLDQVDAQATEDRLDRQHAVREGEEQPVGFEGVHQAAERVAVAEEAGGAHQTEQAEQPQPAQPRDNRDHRGEIDELQGAQEETQSSGDVCLHALRERLLEHVQLGRVVGEDA